MSKVRLIGLIACSVASVATAQAAEPEGCDKFSWPIAREQSALTRSGLPIATAGAERASSPDAFRLPLDPVATAKLHRAPERQPKPETFAGSVVFTAPERAGLYQVTLSDGAWIDLVQGDTYLKPVRFSGATGCTGVRKLVRFDLAARPFLLQVSGASSDAIGVIVQRIEAGQAN